MKKGAEQGLNFAAKVRPTNPETKDPKNGKDQSNRSQRFDKLGKIPATTTSDTIGAGAVASNQSKPVDANGAEKKGRGQAAMMLDADLNETATGTRVDVTMDLQLSGAAAQYGRGLVKDVTAVLMDDFAANMQNRLVAIAAGLDPNQVDAVKPASGFSIALRAARTALARVFRRFFMPYNPELV